MSKQKKFCTILKYIEKTDPKFYEVIDDFCGFGLFKQRRDHAGVTFIYPSKETISKLEKLRYSEDIEVGIDILMAHIVHDFLPNAAAWNAKKSDIPNGANMKIEVASVKGDRIVLADGAELEQDKNFRPFNNARSENKAVFRVVKGALDHTKHKKPATFEHARSRPGMSAQMANKAVKGGGKVAQRKMVNTLKQSLVAHLDDGDDLDFAEQGVAPFGFMIEFDKWIQESGRSDSDKLKSKLIHSAFTPITNALYSLSSNQMGLASAVEEFQSYLEGSGETTKKLIENKVYGRDKYMELCAKNFSELQSACGGASGGATRDFLYTHIRNIVKELSVEHKNKLQMLKMAGREDVDSEWFSSLCISRHIECAKMNDIDFNNAYDAKHAIDELVDVIQDQAEGQCLNSSSVDIPSLSVYIKDYLESMQKFASCDFCCYPLNGSKSKAGSEKCGSELKKYYKDESILKALNGLDANVLSQFLSELSS